MIHSLIFKPGLSCNGNKLEEISWLLIDCERQLMHLRVGGLGQTSFVGLSEQNTLDKSL